MLSPYTESAFQMQAPVSLLGLQLPLRSRGAHSQPASNVLVNSTNC